MKRQKTTAKTATVEHVCLAHQLNEHPIVEWFTSHARDLLIVLVAVSLLLFALFRFFSGGSAATDQHLSRAHEQFQVLTSAAQEGDNAKFDHALHRLESAFERSPELHQKYDAPLAQLLITGGDSTRALSFGGKAIERAFTGDTYPYRDFAETSLLIVQGEYPTALDRSLALHNALQSRGESSSLFAYNLLRIAFLHQRLDHAAEERAQWQEWKRYNDQHIDAFTAIATQFETGNISLMEYIQQREKVLTK